MTTLGSMKTRTLARPVIVLLSNGFKQAYFDHHPDVAAPLPAMSDVHFGKPAAFVPQKVRARRRFLFLAVVGLIMGTLALAWILYRDFD